MIIKIRPPGAVESATLADHPVFFIQGDLEGLEVLAETFALAIGDGDSEIDPTILEVASTIKSFLKGARSKASKSSPY